MARSSSVPFSYDFGNEPTAIPFDPQPKSTPQPTENPQPAPGVPRPDAPSTSSGEGKLFDGNVQPSPKSMFQIKEKLLRPAQTSHYQCWFNPPDDVRKWIADYKQFNYIANQNSELISLSCSEASLPGSSFMTNEITDDYTGVTERHAYRRGYDDRADFTFYVDHGRVDGNYNVLWFFEKWMQYIAVEEDSRGLEDRTFNYRVRFPSNYQTDQLFINKFEKDFKGQVLQYKFMQAYPMSIASIPVSYESSQLLKVTVSFTYTRYLTKRVKANPSSEQEPGQTRPPGVPNPPPPSTPVPKNGPPFTEAQVAEAIRQEREVQLTGQPPSGGFTLF